MKDDMNSTVDLTSYIPPAYASIFPKLVMTEAAQRFIDASANSFGFSSDFSDVHRSVASSAASFRNSVYFVYSRWFNSRPHHPFRAVRYQTTDNQTTEPMLVLDWKNGVILSAEEVQLSDDYWSARLIEIMRVDQITGIPSDVT